jgi:hypothetical protein
MNGRVAVDPLDEGNIFPGEPMKKSTIVLGVLSCLFLALGGAPAAAQNRPPIIDMHLHVGLNQVPPPPTGVCTPFDSPLPLWDQRLPFLEVWASMLTSPPCADPVWSPTTAGRRYQTTARGPR